MNCPQCNARLVGNSRFCGVCGYDLSTLPGAAPAAGNNSPALSTMPDQGQRAGWQAEQPTRPASWPGQAGRPPELAQPSLPAQSGSLPSTRSAQDPYAQPPSWASPAGQPMGQAPAFQDGRGLQNSMPGPAMAAGTLRSEGALYKNTKGRARRRGGVLRWLLSLALLILILASLWFVVVRPYLHNMAQTQVDHVLSSAVNQINPSLLPPGAATVPLTQTTMNNLIVLNSAPSSPVQNMRAQISPGNIRFDFTAYGFACTVTGVPVAQNGLLQMSNVSVQGVLGLIMSPDELTATLNSHLKDASARLRRTITGVVLKDQEMDISIA